MKVPIAIVLVGCCLFGGIMALAAEDESTPKPSELDALRKQVQALEARIEVLEKLLAEQRQGPNALTLPPSLHGRPVPETWSRREFNGMPYYVIPLGQDGNQAPPKK
jgi:hypothetical protein